MLEAEADGCKESGISLGHQGDLGFIQGFLSCDQGWLGNGHVHWKSLSQGAVAAPRRSANAWG